MIYPIPRFLQHLQTAPISASSKVQLYNKIQNHTIRLLKQHHVQFERVTVQGDTLNIYYADTEDPIRIHLSIYKKSQIPGFPQLHGCHGFPHIYGCPLNKDEYHLQFCTLLTRNATFQIKERM